MNLLIDTHTFLWFVNEDQQFSETAAALLESDNTVLLRVASVWEIAIKVSIGKLLRDELLEWLRKQQLALNDIMLLPIRVANCQLVTTLPFHHRDPFDRMIIAQALVEDIPLISIDSAFDAYSVQRLW